MLVSVIIPTFNRPQMLCEAIESVLSQDYPQKEVIVVDDGSTDSTESVVRKYNNLIKYFRIDHGGVSRARNRGIAEASGELIAFLDSDDLWLPEKLKVQVDYFSKHRDITICQTEEVWIRNGVRVNPKNIHKKHSGWIFEHCVPRCIVSPSAVMMRRELLQNIGNFDEKMPVCEDYDLWLRIALKYQIITIDVPLIIKRGGHSDQLSKEHSQDVWRIYALEKIIKTPEAAPFRDLVMKDIARRSTIVSKGAYKRGNASFGEVYQSLAKKYSH